MIPLLRPLEVLRLKQFFQAEDTEKHGRLVVEKTNLVYNLWLESLGYNKRCLSNHLSIYKKNEVYYSKIFILLRQLEVCF